MNHQVDDLLEKVKQIKNQKELKETDSPTKYKFFRKQVEEKEKYILELEKKLLTAFEFLAMKEDTQFLGTMEDTRF